MAATFVQTMAGQTLNLDVSKSMGGAHRDVAGLCTDLFLIVIKMRDAEDLGDPGALRKLIRHYIELFRKNCTAISVDDQAVGDAMYALVALVDETVLSTPGACRDYWLSRPLQLDYFGHNIAGEEFYRRLDRILVEFEKNRDVAEVYYLCLSLGFEGKYKMGDKTERTRRVEQLGEQLQSRRGRLPASLSPHGGSEGGRKSAGPSVGMGVPVWASAVVGVLLLGAWYGFLYFLSRTNLEEMLDSIAFLGRSF